MIQFSQAKTCDVIKMLIGQISHWKNIWSNFGPRVFGGFLSMNRFHKFIPQHLKRIQVRTLTRPLQRFHFVFVNVILHKVNKLDN